MSKKQFLNLKKLAKKGIYSKENNDNKIEKKMKTNLQV